jgi:predicted HD phosphohydrolase
MRGFEYKVAHIVEGHVLAKRYLTGTDQSYADMLSSGSQRTLEFQGGPMDETEAKIFESDSLFEENVQMRKWDEGAKVDGLSVPAFEHYKDVVMSCINFQACPVDEFAKWGGLAYKRSGNAIVAPAHAKAAL